MPAPPDYRTYPRMHERAVVSKWMLTDSEEQGGIVQSSSMSANQKELEDLLKRASSKLHRLYPRGSAESSQLSIKTGKGKTKKKIVSTKSSSLKTSSSNKENSFNRIKEFGKTFEFSSDEDDQQSSMSTSTGTTTSFGASAPLFSSSENSLSQSSGRTEHEPNLAKTTSEEDTGKDAECTPARLGKDYRCTGWTPGREEEKAQHKGLTPCGYQSTMKPPPSANRLTLKKKVEAPVKKMGKVATSKFYEAVNFDSESETSPVKESETKTREKSKMLRDKNERKGKKFYSKVEFSSDSDSDQNEIAHANDIPQPLAPVNMNSTSTIASQSSQCSINDLSQRLSNILSLSGKKKVSKKKPPKKTSKTLKKSPSDQNASIAGKLTSSSESSQLAQKTFSSDSTGVSCGSADLFSQYDSVSNPPPEVTYLHPSNVPIHELLGEKKRTTGQVCDPQHVTGESQQMDLHLSVSVSEKTPVTQIFRRATPQGQAAVSPIHMLSDTRGEMAKSPVSDLKSPDISIKEICDRVFSLVSPPLSQNFDNMSNSWRGQQDGSNSNKTRNNNLIKRHLDQVKTGNLLGNSCTSPDADHSKHNQQSKWHSHISEEDCTTDYGLKRAGHNQEEEDDSILTDDTDEVQVEMKNISLQVSLSAEDDEQTDNFASPEVQDNQCKISTESPYVDRKKSDTAPVLGLDETVYYDTQETPDDKTNSDKPWPAKPISRSGQDQGKGGKESCSLQVSLNSDVSEDDDVTPDLEEPEVQKRDLSLQVSLQSEPSPSTRDSMSHQVEAHSISLQVSLNSYDGSLSPCDKEDPCKQDQSGQVQEKVKKFLDSTRLSTGSDAGDANFAQGNRDQIKDKKCCSPQVSVNSDVAEDDDMTPDLEEPEVQKRDLSLQVSLQSEPSPSTRDSMSHQVEAHSISLHVSLNSTNDSLSPGDKEDPCKQDQSGQVQEKVKKFLNSTRLSTGSDDDDANFTQGSQAMSIIQGDVTHFIDMSFEDEEWLKITAQRREFVEETTKGDGDGKSTAGESANDSVDTIEETVWRTTREVNPGDNSESDKDSTDRDSDESVKQARDSPSSKVCTVEETLECCVSDKVEETANLCKGLQMDARDRNTDSDDESRIHKHDRLESDPGVVEETVDCSTSGVVEETINSGSPGRNSTDTSGTNAGSSEPSLTSLVGEPSPPRTDFILWEAKEASGSRKKRQVKKPWFDEEDSEVPDLDLQTPVQQQMNRGASKNKVSDDSSDEELEKFFVKMKTPATATRKKKLPSMEEFIISDSDVSSDSDSDDCAFYLRTNNKLDTPLGKRVPLASSRSSGNSSSPPKTDTFKTPSTMPRRPKATPKSKPLPSVRPATAPRLRIQHSVTASTSSHTNRSLSETTASGVCGFLSSLTTDMADHRRNPEAARYVRNFKKLKEELTVRLFKLFNETVFDNKLPADLPIEWNSRLTRTAGQCVQKKHKTSQSREVKVQLAIKVCDSAERLRDTLVHELCHAAVWVINGLNDGHGPYWRYWTRKANLAHPDIPAITCRHDYQIHHKYIYKCTKCGYQFGRHSKSLDTTKKVCGHCRSPFELLVNRGNGTQGTPVTPRTLNPFALYVKNNFQNVKARNTDLTHKDVMSLLSAEFAKSKINDD